MTNMEYEILQAVESVDGEVLAAEFAVLDAMYKEYSKALTLMEYCKDETVLEQFDIFAEAEDSDKDDGDKLTEGGFWKKKDNTAGKKILAFIPRLFQAIGRLIKSIFSKTPKETAEEIKAAGDAAVKAASTEAGAEVSTKIAEATQEVEETISSKAQSFVEWVKEIKDTAKKFYDEHGNAVKAVVGGTAVAALVGGAYVAGGKEIRNNKFQSDPRIQEECKKLHNIAYVNAKQRKGYVTVAGYKISNIKALIQKYSKLVEEFSKKPNKNEKYANKALELSKQYLTKMETKSYPAESFSTEITSLRHEIETGHKEIASLTAKFVDDFQESKYDSAMLNDLLNACQGISNVYTIVLDWIKELQEDISHCRMIWQYLNGEENKPETNYPSDDFTNASTETIHGKGTYQGQYTNMGGLEPINQKDPQGLESLEKNKKKKMVNHNASPEVVNRETKAM